MQQSQNFIENIKYEILSDPQFKSKIYNKTNSQLANIYSGFYSMSIDANEQHYLIETIKAEILKDLGYYHNYNNSFNNNYNNNQNGNYSNFYNNLNNSDPLKLGMQERLSHMFTNGQLKGVLYGLGTAILAGLVLPSTGRKFQSVAVKTVEDGMDLVDRARSIVARVKEGIEDILAETNYKRNSFGFSENLPEEADMIIEPAYERIRKDRN